ncbi:MAG: methionine aminotransferase [Chitinophagales bacterium]|nr:methionine aminotransferase [Chitinophagales bacterium]MDW8272783.1 methionine aminotransferase [Chitinophagales bacterium]
MSICYFPLSKLPQTGTTIFTIMSAKAKAYGAVNLSQGFPDFDPDERLIEALMRALRGSHHQYAPMAGNILLREKLCEKYHRLWGLQLHPENEITITAGGTQALFTAIQAIVKPGDEVILLAPCYDSYAPAVQLAGGTCVYYNMLPPDFDISWEQLSRLVNEKTRLIIFNSPHNPTASILKKHDIEQLIGLLERHSNLLLLSDEVYEHIVFDEEGHQSFLRYEPLFQRSMVVSSFGKTYHTTGWKVGYCIAPETLTTEFRKVHQYNVFSVNSLAQQAFAEILDYPELYDDLSAFYKQKRNKFYELFGRTRFKFLPCKGTYFQLADYGDISEMADIDFCDHLVRNYGVAAIPVSVFYHNAPESLRLIRFCFAKKDETLAEAANRLQGL